MNKKDDGSILSVYLKEINKIPLLTREEEDKIARKAIKGDENAKSTLVESHLRFVVNTAKKYGNRGLPLEDLISEGNIGLMNAIERFDPNRGYHFISYAVWWIRQAILKAIYEKSHMIRLPLNRANELTQIEKTKKLLLTEMGEDPSNEQIAKITGIKEQDVADLQSISRELLSLESPVYDESDSSTLGDFIEDDEYMGPVEQVLSNSLSNDIESVLGTLSEKEADILRWRFGLGYRNQKSLKEIGDDYNLTKERIRQIEKKALERLRHPSRMQILRDYLAA